MLDMAAAWDEIEMQLSLFGGQFFPALNRIVLFGDWDSFTADLEFRSLCNRVRSRGCALEYPAGILDWLN